MRLQRIFRMWQLRCLKFSRPAMALVVLQAQSKGNGPNTLGATAPRLPHSLLPLRMLLQATLPQSSLRQSRSQAQEKTGSWRRCSVTRSKMASSCYRSFGSQLLTERSTTSLPSAQLTSQEPSTNSIRLRKPS